MTLPSNRRLPSQWTDGNTIDATRIEACLQQLIEDFNDVPADCVGRRWSPSWPVWGMAPANLPFVSPFAFSWARSRRLPFLSAVNSVYNSAVFLQQPPSYTNPQRVKSCGVPTIDPTLAADDLTGDLLTWEVSWVCNRPTLIGSLAVLAEWQSGGPYQNDWVYGAAFPVLPPGLANGDATTDFTLQCCVDDAWDVQNRRKLRQESLIFKMRSDAFQFFGQGGADTILPARPVSNGSFAGFAVRSNPLILVPTGGRVRMQWTVPLYKDADSLDVSTWGPNPMAKNLWSLACQLWSPAT